MLQTHDLEGHTSDGFVTCSSESERISHYCVTVIVLSLRWRFQSTGMEARDTYSMFKATLDFCRSSSVPYRDTTMSELCIEFELCVCLQTYSNHIWPFSFKKGWDKKKKKLNSIKTRNSNLRLGKTTENTPSTRNSYPETRRRRVWFQHKSSGQHEQ